jgi:hypothetical protein
VPGQFAWVLGCSFKRTPESSWERGIALGRYPGMDYIDLLVDNNCVPVLKHSEHILTPMVGCITFTFNKEGIKNVG